MDGAHRLARTGELTSAVLDRVFRVLSTRRVSLEGMLLKPNMVVPGTECPEPVSVTEVATATLSVLRRHVPAAVPGIVVSLRSAGRPACHRAPERHERRPWNAPVARFSYGRALQDPALKAWGGRPSGVEAGQQALHHRVRCNGAASLGT